VANQAFARLVSLACHDLRTPLATVNGFAKTLLRSSDLDEREARFVDLIDAAAGQMTELLDLLGLAARIESGRYEPSLREVDTLELVRGQDMRIVVRGTGETITADVPALAPSLEALAVAALRHGALDQVQWTVRGRELELEPLTEAAAPVVTGESPKDFGALVARMAIENAGGSLNRDGETLRVRL
jgi:light-regulated signal transduction histidine kinase (bacteriophytochrome)